RCWSGHRIRQPGIKRKLSRLSNGTNEKRGTNEDDHRSVCFKFRGVLRHGKIIQSIGMESDHKNSHQQTKVANTVHDECFSGCFAVFLVVIPETDQKVRAKSYTFPADKQDHIIASHNKEQHHKHEQVQIGKKSVEALISVHITDRVQVYQRTDTGDEDRKSVV